MFSFGSGGIQVLFLTIHMYYKTAEDALLIINNLYMLISFVQVNSEMPLRIQMTHSVCR
jgi:hypothetical protein